MTMRSITLVLVLSSVAGCGLSRPPSAPTITAPSKEEIPLLVEAAGRGETSAAARLRAAGPEGFEAVLAAYDASASEPEKQGRLASALDVVAAQKDAHAARLYWSTDLEEAKARAKTSGKPILSLRLLGRLDEELSCANSRFFRTALYPNQEVGTLLREKFILHWSTERPAPIITIDFRDGRRIKRTVTGNSLHYVLDQEGRVVDAIPGLYGPRAFAMAVARAGEVARQTQSLDDDDRARALASWHAGALAALRREWPDALASAGVFARVVFPADVVAPAAPSSPPPPAMVAMPVAPTKAIVEMPLIKGTMRMPEVTVPELPWSQMSVSRAPYCKLDAASIALVREKRPRSWTDAKAMGRPLSDDELVAVVRGFESSMAADTVKNELVHHAIIHRWLGEAARTHSGGDDFARLNARVYTELFKTPASDPWLGLVPPSVFTGIQDDGIGQ